MTDHLSWRERHFVFLKHPTVAETVGHEKFPLRADLEPDAEAAPEAGAFIERLSGTDRARDAASFLAYALHRRAAVWWVYQCLITLRKELEEAPPQEIDITQIAAPKTFELPEWAREPEPEEDKIAELQEKLTQEVARFEASKAEMLKFIPPEVQRLMDQILENIRQKFKNDYGVDDIFAFIREQASKIPPADMVDIENSPITKAARDLRERLEKQRQETIAAVQAVIPPKVPAHEAKIRAQALDAVWNWICAPTVANAKAALDAGNAASQEPEGMLALSAFWSFGNLDTTGEHLVPTPAGLAANGLSSTLLMAGLKKGGTRKFKERMTLYLNLGLEVAWGRSSWDEGVRLDAPPHRTPGWLPALMRKEEKPEEEEAPLKTTGRFRVPPASGRG